MLLHAVQRLLEAPEQTIHFRRGRCDRLARLHLAERRDFLHCTLDAIGNLIHCLHEDITLIFNLGQFGLAGCIFPSRLLERLLDGFGILLPCHEPTRFRDPP